MKFCYAIIHLLSRLSIIVLSVLYFHQMLENGLKKKIKSHCFNSVFLILEQKEY